MISNLENIHYRIFVTFVYFFNSRVPAFPAQCSEITHIFHLLCHIVTKWSLIVCNDTLGSVNFWGSQVRREE